MEPIDLRGVGRAGGRRPLRDDAARAGGSTPPTAPSSRSARSARGREGNRPPSELRPMGLEGPLGWLAEQLEARDRAAMTWIWRPRPHDLAPTGPLVVRLRAPLSALEPRVRVPRPAGGDATATASGRTAAAGRWRGDRRGSNGRLRHAGDSAAPWPSSTPANSPLRRSPADGPTCWSGIPRSGCSGPSLERQAAEQEGRVGGQGGRGPGRQRHRRPRPADAARQPQGPGAPARPGDPRGRAGAGACPTRRRWKGVEGEARSLSAIEEPDRRPRGHRRIPPRVPRHAAPRGCPEAGRAAKTGTDEPSVRARIGSSSRTWPARSRSPAPR